MSRVVFIWGKFHWRSLRYPSLKYVAKWHFYYCYHISKGTMSWRYASAETIWACIHVMWPCCSWLSSVYGDCSGSACLVFTGTDQVHGKVAGYLWIINCFGAVKSHYGFAHFFKIQEATKNSSMRTREGVSFMSLKYMSNLLYKSHLIMEQICCPLRCSWSIACWRCSNYIFILDLTPALNGLGKDNCKVRWKTF